MMKRCDAESFESFLDVVSPLLKRFHQPEKGLCRGSRWNAPK